MSRLYFTLCGLMLSILLVAGCAMPPPPQATEAEATPDTAAAAAETPAAEAPEDVAVVLTVVESDPFGEYLADAEGRPLYLFTADEGADGSTCTGDCAENWPPLTVELETNVTAGEPIDDLLFDTIERDDGTFQVTYNGWPLYYFAQDEGADTPQGQGLGDQWYLVAPAGTAIEATADGAAADATPEEADEEDADEEEVDEEEVDEEEVDEEEMTPEATEEAGEEAMTPEATEEAAEEAVTPEATEEAAEEMTAEPTEEAVEEATPEPEEEADE